MPTTPLEELVDALDSKDGSSVADALVDIADAIQDLAAVIAGNRAVIEKYLP